MKKFWLLASSITLALGLAACSDKEESKTEEKTSGETAKEEPAKETNLKKPMVNFYSELTTAINGADADLNAYEHEEKPTPEMKTKASESAAAVAEAVKGVQIPEELKDQKADLEAALKDLSDSYQAKSQELTKPAPSLDAASATFTQGVDKLGATFESVELLKPDLGKQVN
ncbi:hypothetical protein [Bacillus sp. M6-12]|uniref:hypothetical protein n=1 Tax=Bacillus sp. M6-12 TaxID=2054166 RepID=UPI00115B81A9|nr:hypothetical protein [Bacillus sp. M6-12]